MKATVIDAQPSPDTIQVAIFICGIVLILLWRIIIYSPKPDYGKVVTILKDEQGIEAEDAGETNTAHLFSISISAVTQHFDLNAFVDKMKRLGCAVLSTADTNNPSFRTLTVQVPKNAKGIGLCTFLSIGCLFGAGLAGWFYNEELYNSFPVLKTILKNV